MTTRQEKELRKHSFSIELNSREQLTDLILPPRHDRKLYLEGYLGELLQISLVESAMLEVQCTHGTLRMDLTEDEYRKALGIREGNNTL